MMKKKTKVEEQEKEDKQDSEEEKAQKLFQQDQVNLDRNGYFRQQLLGMMERGVQAQEKNTEAIEKLVKLVESSEESGEKEELKVPEPSDEE